MIDKLDTVKTLKRNRLIFDRNVFEHYFDWVVLALLIIIPPAITVFYSLSNIESFKTDLLGQIISNVLSFGFVFYIISGIRQSFGLHHLKGTSLTDNKDVINNIIKNNNWTLYKDCEDYMIIATGRLKSQINIIFTQNDIVVNSVTFGRNDLISPFFQMRNRENIDKIIEEYKKYAL